MRRTIGIVILAVAAVAAVVLLVAGQLGEARVANVSSGGNAVGHWTVVDYAVTVNWPVVVPLAVVFFVGILCVAWPRRRPE